MENKYRQILNELKESIRSARQRTSIAVNEQLLFLYWEIGNTILSQQREEGWGTKVISRLAKDLKSEFPDMKGLSERNLKYMRLFAEAYPKGLVQEGLAQFQKLGIESNVQAPLAQITWYHHITLLEKVKNAAKRAFYIAKTIENGWSRNVMLAQIESRLHERQGAALTNFKSTLPAYQSDLAIETVKSPYIFDFLCLGEEIKERDLESALIQNIKKFLLELGKGFAYVGNQYNLEVDGNDFFLDLLFYNTRLHCYVIFELKIGDFKPEFAGKLNFYVNTIDAQLKSEADNPTIGILLCKTPNKTVVEYSLKGVEKPLGVSEYQLYDALPENLKDDLPTVQELEEELDREVEIVSSSLVEKIKSIKSKSERLKKPAIQESKNSEAIRKIVDQFLYPLWDQLKLDGKELIELFTHDRSTLNNRGHGVYTKEDFGNLLINEPNPYELKIEINLDGFIPAGTEAFQVYKQLTIRLLDLKYQFFYHSDQKPDSEYLYHELPSNTEITAWSHKILEDISNQIEERLDNLNPSEQ